MTTHKQTSDNQQRQSEKSPAAENEQAPAQANLDLPRNCTGVQAQATLTDPRFNIAQRQAIATQLGRISGNQYLQRVIGANQPTEQGIHSAKMPLPLNSLQIVQRLSLFDRLPNDILDNIFKYLGYQDLGKLLAPGSGVSTRVRLRAIQAQLKIMNDNLAELLADILKYKTLAEEAGLPVHEGWLAQQIVQNQTKIETGWKVALSLAETDEEAALESLKEVRNSVVDMLKPYTKPKKDFAEAVKKQKVQEEAELKEKQRKDKLAEEAKARKEAQARQESLKSEASSRAKAYALQLGKSDYSMAAALYDPETNQWYIGHSGHGLGQGQIPAGIWNLIPNAGPADFEMYMFGKNCAEVHCIHKAYAKGKIAPNLEGCVFGAYHVRQQKPYPACGHCRKWIKKLGGAYAGE